MHQLQHPNVVPWRSQWSTGQGCRDLRKLCDSELASGAVEVRIRESFHEDSAFIIAPRTQGRDLKNMHIYTVQ